MLPFAKEDVVKVAVILFSRRLLPTVIKCFPRVFFCFSRSNGDIDSEKTAPLKCLQPFPEVQINSENLLS